MTVATELKDVCSLEGAMTNLDSRLKSKDITLMTKVHIVKGMIFPVVMYGCENWTIKKAVIPLWEDPACCLFQLGIPGCSCLSSYLTKGIEHLFSHCLASFTQLNDFETCLCF